jgi:Ca2+/Na+ antiporter
MFFDIILISAPIILGLAFYFLKIEAVYDFTENAYIWLASKNRNILSGKSAGSKIARYSLVPLYTLFITLNDLTSNISDVWLRSSIRIMAYLYLIGSLFIIAVSLAYGLMVIAIFVVLSVVVVLLRKEYKKYQKEASQKKRKSSRLAGEESSAFVTKFWPFFISGNTKEKVGELFYSEEVKVDYKGRIFFADQTQLTPENIIGYIDSSGNIFDARKRIPKKIGKIDERGNVTGLFLNK